MTAHARGFWRTYSRSEAYADAPNFRPVEKWYLNSKGAVRGHGREAIILKQNDRSEIIGLAIK